LVSYNTFFVFSVEDINLASDQYRDFCDLKAIGNPKPSAGDAVGEEELLHNGYSSPK
jgi:hypothetical protein